VRTGKLPPELLARLLRRIPATDPRVLLGSGIGEDAAAIDFGAPPGAPLGSAVDTAGAAAPPGGSGAVPASSRTAGAAAGDRVLIAKTDPITFATDLIGWYAVHVNANDVACTGATPRWFMASALLPETWDEPEIEALFDQLVEACRGLGVALVGGHTEVTGGLDRPIVAGCMLGEVERARMVRTGGGVPGDALILTQGLAIEGTAVLAREAEAELRRRGVSAAQIERAQRYLFEPGISVVGAAQALCAAVPPGEALHSLHDPTEGGLAAGVWELAEASGTGAVLDVDTVPILPETRLVCDALGLDPLGLLASGALLAAVAPGTVQAALAALERHHLPARVIGRLTPRADGVRLRGGDGRLGDWPRFERDEVARYFDRE
jgi:hydrogenase maturation factor